jgi:hypothetical protein
MANHVRIIGIHPVEADEPVRLIELEIDGAIDDFDFGQVTQDLPNQPRAKWQAVYDERELSREAERARFAFFFHYLDFDKPLLTPFGPVKLPPESPLPEHLQGVEYERP